MLTEAVQRTGGREAGWVNRLFSNEVYTAEHQELKFTLHRKLLDRINLEALSSMAGERARTEIRAAVARLVEEEKTRSEEHTSELQSPMYLVCRLLLEKKT